MNPADINVADLLPHAAPMVLLDELVDVTEDTLTARVTVRGDGLFDKHGAVSCVLGAEYMAQAIAAWAGFHAVEQGERVKPGLLLGVRQYESSVAGFVVGEVLDVRVVKVMQSAAGLAVFDCTIHNDRVSLMARLTVITVDSFDELNPAQ